MLKISLRFYLVANVLMLLGICLAHGYFSVDFIRLLSIIFFSSFCLVPGTIVVNGIFSFIRSLKMTPVLSWIFFVVIISSVNHLVINIMIMARITDQFTAQSLLLILNSSSLLALILQFSTIHHLFKSFVYEKEQSFTIG
jgi:hypothetical protein